VTLLSAGFHLMTGYFRDDAALRLILDEPARRVDAFGGVPLHHARFVRQYKDFIFFERAEPPDLCMMLNSTSRARKTKTRAAQAKIDQLAQAYLAKRGEMAANGQPSPPSRITLRIISRYSPTLSKPGWPRTSHLQALLNFAERAYRRPLSQAGATTFSLSMTRFAKRIIWTTGSDPRHGRQRVVSPTFAFALTLVSSSERPPAAGSSNPTP